MDKIIVIDASHIAHRARFSIGALNNGIIYGFLICIVDFAEAHKTNKFVFAFDSKESIRKEHFPAYKEKRHKDLTKQEKKELDLTFEQLGLLRTSILPKMGFKNILIQAGLEGDDIIAKVVRNFPKGNEQYIMVATDKDLYQLLGPNVSMWKRSGLYTEKNFVDEWGITPRKWKRVKAIGGCSSDEVPGVAGVAEKTSCKYLRGELKTTSKAYQKITSDEGREIDLFNRPLVYLPHSAAKDITLVPDALSLRRFEKIFQKYNMKSFLKERMDEWERVARGYPSIGNKRRR